MAEDKKIPENPNDAARDQFAALGSFIQNFEFVVSVLRRECSRIIQGAQLGVTWNNPKANLFISTISSIPFHHDALHGRMIIDIWQALTFEQCKALVALNLFSERSREISYAVASDVANEFRGLVDLRNRLVHASWAIGRWPHYETDFSKLTVEKFQLHKKRGLERREDLPKSFDELIYAGKKTQQLADDLGRFLQFFAFVPGEIEHVFVESKRSWAFSREKYDARTRLKASREKSQ
jgi:hypothetical protein